MEVICLHINRWSEVVLKINGPSRRFGGLRHYIDNLRSMNPAMLERLQISHSRNSPESKLDLTHAHNLKYLVLESMSWFQVMLPAGLVYLKIETPVPINYILDILRSCPMVEFASVCPESQESSSANGYILSAHLNILQLIICHGDSGAAGVLLDHMIFPSLSDVELIAETKMSPS